MADQSRMSLPDAAAVFTLTAAQAAEVMDMPLLKFLDLVRAGAFHALLVPPSETTNRPPLAFSPSLLAHDRDAYLMANTRDLTRLAAYVSDALRDYLAEEPVGTPEEALSLGRAWLTFDRHNHIRVHVHDKRMVELANKGRSFDGARPLIQFKNVSDVMIAWGARVMKGLRDPATGRQRWENWWRLPGGMWSQTDGLSLMDSPRLAASALERMAAGERVH